MFNPNDPAFSGPAKNGYAEGFTKREVIRLETFKAMCQNTTLVTALANIMHPSQLKEQLIKQSLEFADDFIAAMENEGKPAEPEAPKPSIITM